MTTKLKIISDGTSIGTHVYAGNVEITGVVGIEFEPIKMSALVKAKISFIGVELDIVAELAK